MNSNFACAFAAAAVALLWRIQPAQAQDVAKPQVGVVYYADGSEFKPLEKVLAKESGRKTFSAKIKGSHASLRLGLEQPLRFKICGVDPTRYKLYVLKSSKDSRTVAISRNNIWIGGGKYVLAESEVPVKLEPVENGCYIVTTNRALEGGEYGFSPYESNDVFPFGVGPL